MTHDQAIRSLATERYVLNEMPELERFAFEEHFFTCPDCAEDVREAAKLRQGVREGLAGTSQSSAATPASPTRRAGSGWTTVVPWAAAASLALLVGYQSLVTVPGLRRLEEPQAVTPVTLRPASRGADPVITVAADDTAVALAIDVAAAPGSTIAYELQSDAGGSIASGTASVQSAGAPLLLWVPAAALMPPGRFVVLVRDRDGSAEPTAYRFTVAAR